MKKTALIIRMSALGDVAMTLPAIYSFARANQDIKVLVLTQPFFARLFVGKPENIEILAVDKKQIKGVKGLLWLLKMLSTKNITMVADLHNVLRSWLIDAFFLLKGVPVKIVDKNRAGRKDILKGAKLVCEPFVNRYFKTLARLNGPFADSFENLPVVPRENPVGVKLVGIAPFARYENKIYSLEQMRKAVEELASRGYKVMLFGGRGKEAEQLATWEVIDGVECVAGKFAIEEELQLMASLNVMVSMDSANMHLASLVGTPVVSVWGSTTPACGFLGWKQKGENCVVANLPCQPCTISGSNKCKLHEASGCEKFQCMKFDPMMIVEKVEQVLKN